MRNELALGKKNTKVTIMITTLEIEQHALRLPETQRARLVTRILDSLSPRLIDPDDGLAEALSRANELDTGRATGISQRELDEKIRSRRQLP